MKTPARFRFLAAALLVCCTSPPEESARTVADSWLKWIDAGNYDEAWKLTAGTIQSEIGRDEWEATVNEARDHGAVQSRTFLDAEFATEPLKMPPGEYVVVRYETGFANRDAVEIVIPTKEPNGSWKVAAYYVSTPARRE